jgi:hypothetical protein
MSKRWSRFKTGKDKNGNVKFYGFCGIMDYGFCMFLLSSSSTDAIEALYCLRSA